MKIYVVFGETGEYSDRVDWPVKAFRLEVDAKTLVVEATARAKEIETSRESKYRVFEGINEFDPAMEMDYTGTSYYICEVELVSSTKKRMVN